MLIMLYFTNTCITVHGCTNEIKYEIDDLNGSTIASKTYWLNETLLTVLVNDQEDYMNGKKISIVKFQTYKHNKY